MLSLRRPPSRPALGAPSPAAETLDADPASLSEVWRRVWEAPDPALSHAGAAGELLVAKIRAVLAVFILYLPLSYWLVEPQHVTNRVAIALEVLSGAERRRVETSLKDVGGFAPAGKGRAVRALRPDGSLLAREVDPSLRLVFSRERGKVRVHDLVRQETLDRLAASSSSSRSGG